MPTRTHVRTRPHGSPSEVHQRLLYSVQQRNAVHTRVITIIEIHPHLLTLSSSISIIPQNYGKIPGVPHIVTTVHTQKPWATKKGAEAPLLKPSPGYSAGAWS